MKRYQYATLLQECATHGPGTELTLLDAGSTTLGITKTCTKWFNQLRSAESDDPTWHTPRYNRPDVTVHFDALCLVPLWSGTHGDHRRSGSSADGTRHGRLD